MSDTTLRPGLAAPATDAPAAADWLLLFAPGAIWGASFLFMAEGLKALGPSGVTFVRIAIGCATLSLLPASRKPVPREAWPGIAWLGVLWLALPLSMFPFAEQRVSSALTGMLNGAVPLAAAIVASVLARRLPPGRVAAGLAVGLAGAVMMALPALGEGRSSSFGILMILVAVLAYGFVPSLARALQQKHGALPVIWRAEIVAVVLTAPLGVPDLLHAHWTLVPLLSMLALGALGTGLAHALMTVATGRLGATRASSTAFLMPAVALVLGVVVLRESVAWMAVAGGAACVGGAWLMKRAASA